MTTLEFPIPDPPPNLGRKLDSEEIAREIFNGKVSAEWVRTKLKAGRVRRRLVRCGCRDAQIHGDGCKHGLCVRLHSGFPEVVRVRRQLIPNRRCFPSKRRRVPA